MKRSRACALVLSCLALWLALPAQAQQTGKEGPNHKDSELLQEVWKRLLAVAEPVEGYEWPPPIEIVTNPEINAYASVKQGKDRPAPFSVMFTGMLDKVIQGDPDRMAYVLGHELSHILLKHVGKPPKGKTEFVKLVFNREQEIAADMVGVELLLKAGYSWKRGKTALMKMIDLKLNQSSFEGLSATHPPWQERIRLTDKEQAKLWKAMAAFHDGAVFLMTEQFILAERCFERVTREFPDCYEAWANLGYAKLMMYCDALDTPDLRRFDVGHLVLGGFYLRPKSLGPELRGVDEDLWFAAVGALRESLRLKPDQALAKANLGLAYLLRPAGKDVGKATQFLDEAAELAARDESLDPMVRVALLINGGVAEMAGGREKEVLAKFEKAEQLAKKAVATARTPSPKVSGALLYNRALMLAGAKDDKSQRQALDMLEKYLRTTSPASAWWPLAYARYTRLCKTLELAPRSEKELQKSAPGTPRLVASVKLPSGTVVGLTEPLEAVVKQLGKGTAVPVMADTNLHRVHYPDHGIDLIVTDNVLAIYLLGPKAPALPLRGKGLGEKGPELKVGMTKAALEAALGEEDYEFIELERRDVNYRFYRRVGLAVRLTQNRVSEMVIVQFPERRLQ